MKDMPLIGIKNKKEVSQIISFLIDIFWVVVIYLIVGAIWALAENFIYGQVTTRHIDTVVGIILAISLYMNIKS